MHPTPRRLFCVGTAVVDIVMYVKGLPERGGDVVASSSMLAVGGAFNVMLAARRQRLEVTYAGGHGTGPFGEMVRAVIAEAGIEAAAPVTLTADTGFTIAFVTGDGERTFATARGAEATIRREGLDALDIRAIDMVYVSGYALADLASGVAIADWVTGLQPTVTVVADPGPLVEQIPEQVLRAIADRCDWWTCNQREAQMMTGQVSPKEAIGGLSKLAGRKGVVVRIGASGCFLAERGCDVVHLPAPKMSAVDTSGAGDAHTGAFLAALAYGLEPRVALQRANVAGAIAVSRTGPATSPTAEELARALMDLAGSPS